jgi:hypothetical protein
MAHEYCIYPLIGEALVRARRSGQDFTKTTWHHLSAGRRHIFPDLDDDYIYHRAMRLPGSRWFEVEMYTNTTFSALLLHVDDDVAKWGNLTPEEPCIIDDWDRQIVGRLDEQRRREVWHLDRPQGFHLDVGETMNEPGYWSSTPSHANDNDITLRLQNQTEWEEVFYCLLDPADSFALMRLDGVYANGDHAHHVQQINNGHALMTPLGEHPIVAAPKTKLWYFWGYYGNALRKTYNRDVTDTGTYIK